MPLVENRDDVKKGIEVTFCALQTHNLSYTQFQIDKLLEIEAKCYLLHTLPTYTVLPALRANSCIAIDRLMIELLDFHIPFLSFTNAGFKGYGKNLLNRRLRITQLP